MCWNHLQTALLYYKICCFSKIDMWRSSCVNTVCKRKGWISCCRLLHKSKGVDYQPQGEYSRPVHLCTCELVNQWIFYVLLGVAKPSNHWQKSLSFLLLCEVIVLDLFFKIEPLMVENFNRWIINSIYISQLSAREKREERAKSIIELTLSNK